MEYQHVNYIDLNGKENYLSIQSVSINVHSAKFK